jgi:two-component system response regulator HydG
MPHAARLLIVDDEPDICANLADLFGDFGYHVDTAESGPAALRLVEQHAYAAAILDFKMPGMNGLELYRRIRALSAGTVAIVVTAYASTDAVSTMLDAGAWQVLPKPVDFHRLSQLVAEAVDQPLLLVVDDDVDLCESLWELLRDEGLRVSLAHDLRTAETQLARQQHHVVIVDMKLPGGDGLDVSAIVRQSNPEARTLLITGHRAELESRIASALRQDAAAVCYKPFDVPQLLHVVKDLLSQVRAAGS